jgi:hypothetical protein
MKIVIDINGTHLLALLDSGLTHNFVNTEATTHAGIILSGPADLRVEVANGDRLTSPGHYRQMPISIHGERFILNCYGLALGSYDMVLGSSGWNPSV